MIYFAVVTLALLPVAQAQNADLIRKLAVTVDPLGAAKLSGQPGVTVVTEEKDLAKSFGEGIAKQIAGRLDFTKEVLVHVAWGSSGPPFGELKYEVKDTEDGKAMAFFVREPRVDQRGMAYRLGNDFFAVPKTWKVKYGGTR